MLKIIFSKKQLTINNKSFSLVELMVVIAIIGILSAIAIPAYRNYIIRSRLTEAFNILSSWQNKVMEYHSVNGSLPPGCNGSGEFANIYNVTTYIDSIKWCKLNAYNTDGRVEAWMKNIDSTVDGKAILLYVKVTNDIITWTCGTHDVYKMPCKYMPGNCQFFCAP